MPLSDKIVLSPLILMRKEKIVDAYMILSQHSFIIMLLYSFASYSPGHAPIPGFEHN